MQLETIAEHTVDLSILPEKANILDLGCRGFLFSNELRRRGHNVVSVDCDDLSSEGYPYHRIAISDFNGTTNIFKNSDPQATTIKDNGKMHIADTAIECLTLPTFMERIKIPFFDLIKIDVEGSEKEIIHSLTEPPATQLSIEFHIHTGVYNLMDVANILEKLRKLGYNIVQHEYTKQHGGIWNFWSSLFILR